MENRKWWQNTVVYQVYPKSFADTTGNGTGDIQGILGKLDYLESLGVGAIWLTPVYSSPMVDNGYDISDYCGIDPSYGTMEDMEELIRVAKEHGIRIVMDLVYNHSSNQHPWFQESCRSRDNEKSDWYIWRDAKPDGRPPTNWRGIFGGSAWTWCEARQQYYLHTFAEQQPDLNWENPEVRQALYDAANFWLDRGVGGFRIDAITYIKKPGEFLDGEPDAADGMVSVHAMTANTKGILEFLHEFRREVFDGHDIFTVAEANGVGPAELSDWVGEKGAFDMLFEFSHMCLQFPEVETWCKECPWKLTDLKRALSDSQKATAKNGWYPIFFENHDQPRSVNQFFPHGGDKKLAAKAIAAVLMTLRGTPFVYEGQELGMENVAWDSIDCYDDISSHGQYELALQEGFSEREALSFVHTYSRDNARTPMQWTAERNAGFTSGKPWLPVQEGYASCNAAVEDGDPDSVLNWYRRLIQWRQGNEAVLCGAYEELLAESEEIYAFFRRSKNRKVCTVVNFSLQEIPLPDILPKGARRMFGNYAGEKEGCLRAQEAVIYEVQE
ncbi:MAG: alpha-glucosidase [Selenomonadaceae bacterium]|nr:alpha-glucosidase [Selenomonadaceae bacterium]